MREEPEELIVRDAAAWREWLHAGGAGTEAGVWLVLAKKGTTEPTGLRYAEALEEALCYGWIDGQARSRDAATSIQRFTPRRANSRWSQRNVGITERLREQDRMQPAGLAEIERAKADGRWQQAYAGPANAAVPDDLTAALAANPAAAAMFATLNGQNRYAVLHRLGAPAKRPETRARRLAKLVESLAAGETIYPQRQAQDDRPG